ncbi:MAG: hypothetical protein AAF436_15745 [Myxococcota bacterium]
MTRLGAAPWVAMAVTLLLACGDAPFPTLLVFADPTDVEICCDQADALPIVAEEFEVFASGPTNDGIDTSAYDVTLDYTSSAEPVTLSVPSGDSLPLGSSTVAILVEGCDFTEAVVDIEVTLSGERTSGEAFQTGWIGAATVTNTCE